MNDEHDQDHATSNEEVTRFSLLVKTLHEEGTLRYISLGLTAATVVIGYASWLVGAQLAALAQAYEGYLGESIIVLVMFIMCLITAVELVNDEAFDRYQPIQGLVRYKLVLALYVAIAITLLSACYHLPADNGVYLLYLRKLILGLVGLLTFTIVFQLVKDHRLRQEEQGQEAADELAVDGSGGIPGPFCSSVKIGCLTVTIYDV